MIEQEIICRNHHHLQQIEQENGVKEGSLLREIHSHHFLKVLPLDARQVLVGKMQKDTDGPKTHSSGITPSPANTYTNDMITV